MRYVGVCIFGEKKTMKLQRIFTLSIIVVLLSACTQRRYASLTGFQWKSQKIAKHQLAKGYYVAPVKAKSAVEENVTVDTDKHTANEMVSVKVLAKADDYHQKTTQKSNTIEYSNLSSALNQKFTKNKDQRVKAPLAPVLKPVKTAREIAKQLKPQSELQPNGGLIYWILVIVLILLIISLLRTVLGPVLWGLLGTLLLILLILLLGNYLGLW